MNCRECGKSCQVSGYPTGSPWGVYCRACASKRSGLTKKILSRAKMAQKSAQNKNNIIASLRAKIAKFEEREAALNAEIDRLADAICKILGDEQILNREKKKLEIRKRHFGDG